MKYILNILRRLLRKAPSAPAGTPVAFQTIKAQELAMESVYLVRTRKGIVVLY